MERKKICCRRYEYHIIFRKRNHVECREVNAILHDIAFGNGIFAAVGYDGVIMSSVDGEHWETKVEALRYD